MNEKPLITSSFELQRVCAELSLNVAIEDLETYIENDPKGEIDFMKLLEYIGMLKKRFFVPEPKDMNTMRAFMAVAGDGAFADSSQEAKVELHKLIETCEAFELALDSNEITQDGENNITYEQFKTMFHEEEVQTRRLKLGHDFASLAKKESFRQNQRKMSLHAQRKGKRGSTRMSVAGPLVPTPVPPSSTPMRAQQVEAEFESTEPTDQSQSTKAKKKLKKKRNGKHDGGHKLDATTKPCGRTGVYVDETHHEPFLPYLPRQVRSSPSSSTTSPILASIDARVETMKRSQRIMV